MNIEIDLSHDHWKKFNQYIYKQRAKEAKGIFSGFWFNQVLWFILTLTFLTIFKSSFYFHWPTASVLIALVVLFYLYSYWNDKKVRKAYIPSQDGTFFGKKVFSLNDTGIHEEGIGYSKKYSWSVIKSVVNANGLIFAFTDNVSAFIFPVDQLNDVDSVLDTIKRHLGMKIK